MTTWGFASNFMKCHKESAKGNFFVKVFLNCMSLRIVIYTTESTYSCAQNYSTPLAILYDFYGNKSCNIDCCVNSMLPIK